MRLKLPYGTRVTANLTSEIWYGCRMFDVYNPFIKNTVLASTGGFCMRWICAVVLMIGFSANTGDAVPFQGPEDAILAPPPAKLDAQQWTRMFKRYSGTWQSNPKKSTTQSGGTITLHYAPEPDGRSVLYYTGTDIKSGAVQALDGRPARASARPTETQAIARIPVDEFTVANTFHRMKDGRVTSRNTFVMSPDGDAGVFVLMNRDDRTGKWTINGVIHYCRPDNTQCLGQ